MSNKKKPSSKKKPESNSKANFSGFLSDDSGPREIIDLGDIKDELVKEAESDTKVATSTPFVTPVNSPDRQACIESNSVKKSRELFEPLEKTEFKESTKVVRELVIPGFGGGISPVKPCGSSSEVKIKCNTSGNSSVSSKVRLSDDKKMVVDEAAADKFC